MLDAKGLEAAKAWYERHVGDGFTQAELHVFTGFLTAYTQAVGPEPAVAVKPLEWSEYRGFANSTKLIASDVFGNKFARLDNPISKSAGEIAAFKANKQADYERLIRSALVATPPAEPGVEALLNERQKRAEQVHDRILAARDGIRANLSPDSPAWQRDAFNKLHEAHHIMGGDPFDMHMRAALATKPAVKDDETVVEALPLREIRRRVRNIWGAISSNQVIDKDVEGQAKRLLADIDATLAAKDGRS